MSITKLSFVLLISALFILPLHAYEEDVDYSVEYDDPYEWVECFSSSGKEGKTESVHYLACNICKEELEGDDADSWAFPNLVLCSSECEKLCGENPVKYKLRDFNEEEDILDDLTE